MTNEKGLFTVSEDEKLTEEIISVSEGEEYEQEARDPVMLVPGGGIGRGPGMGTGTGPRSEMGTCPIAEYDEQKSRSPVMVVPGGGIGRGPGMGTGTGPRAEMGTCPIAENKDEESDDWRVSKKPKHFVVFLTNEMGRMPQPSSILGNKSMMEKALGQYKKLDSYISNAMHSDYDDEIDVNQVDKVRAVLEKARDEVEDALEGLSHMMKQKKKMRRRRADDTHEGELVREAGIPQFQMLVTPFQRAIAGALINGKVSGGRNMEELWKDAKDKYKMNDREELEILQVLADMGYPEFRDRLRLGEDNDPTRTEGFGEWQSQYYA